jgi:glutaredoxin
MRIKMNISVSAAKNLKSLGMNIAAVALAVAIGFPLGNVLLKQFRATPSATALAPVAIASDTANLLFKDVSEELIVLGDTKCLYCKEGLALLEKLGAKYQVFYIDQDVQARKIYDTLKTEGVPVLISRRQYVTGFNEKMWENFLKSTRSKQKIEFRTGDQ